MERPNAHTLSVFDEKDVQVLLVEYLNPSAIRILGIFRAKGEFPVIIDNDHMTFGRINIGPGFALHVAEAPIFEWPRPKTDNARSYAVKIDGQVYNLLQFNLTNYIADFTFSIDGP